MLRALWPYLAAFRYRVAAALALLVIAKLATVAVPVALKLIVDALGEPGKLAGVPVALLVGYALLRFAGTLFGELRDLVFARVTLRAMADFHQKAFSHLLALSMRFHIQRETGRLTRDVERGIAGVGFLLGVGLFTIVPTLVEIAAVMVILLANYSGWFSLIIAVTFVLYTSWSVVFTQRREVHQRAQNELDSRASGRLTDSLLNYEAVKAHSNEPLEAERYRVMLENWIGIGWRNQKALSTLHVGQSGVIALGVSLVMLLAGGAVFAGNMTVGDLVLINAYVIQICLPLNALGFVFRQARDAVVNAEKLSALLGEQPEVRDAPGAPALHVKRAEVSFEHVHFHYEPRRPVLADISFRIPPGRTVAVVGGSGSGKSTLARLLLRLYDVSSGCIRIDGQDIRAVTQASLRQAVGIVPQDTVLFNDTVAYNIAYGRPGMKLAEVIEAARLARIEQFVASLPEQYDTVVGERGLKISGGEKQRIAIARVILKNPAILIFDEATSALDARAERAIQAELDRIARNRTTLVIAHRMSTIVNADEILVLEHGRIVERGTHAKLLEHHGIYAHMWSLQQQEQALLVEEEKAKPGEPSLSAVSALHGARILVVDDQAEAREVLDVVLGGSGGVVSTAASAAEAVRLLERTPQPQWPDVLICDISLPDEDGYSLLRRVRALEAGLRVEATRRVPAIALTGYAAPEDRAQSRRAGFQAHLTKPVEPPELLAAVERLVGARRAH